MQDPKYAAFQLKKLQLSDSHKKLQTIYNVGGMTDAEERNMMQRLIDEQLAARAAAMGRIATKRRAQRHTRRMARSST